MGIQAKVERPDFEAAGGSVTVDPANAGFWNSVWHTPCGLEIGSYAPDHLLFDARPNGHAIVALQNMGCTIDYV